MFSMFSCQIYEYLKLKHFDIIFMYFYVSVCLMAPANPFEFEFNFIWQIINMHIPLDPIITWHNTIFFKYVWNKKNNLIQIKKMNSYIGCS